MFLVFLKIKPLYSKRSFAKFVQPPKPAILVIIFWNLADLMGFDSSQVKPNLISIMRSLEKKLPRKLPNSLRLRFSENWNTLGKPQIWAGA